MLCKGEGAVFFNSTFMRILSFTSALSSDPFAIFELNLVVLRDKLHHFISFGKLLALHEMSISKQIISLLKSSLSILHNA